MKRKQMTLPKGKHRPKTMKRKHRSLFFYQSSPVLSDEAKTDPDDCVVIDNSDALIEFIEVSKQDEKESESEDSAGTEEPGIEEATGTVETRSIVAHISFLIGVRSDYLKHHYGDCSKIIDNLQESEDAIIIRYLCKIRTTLIQKYGSVDRELRYELKNLDRQEYFDTQNIRKLESYGVQVIQANYTAEKYLMEICRLISIHIDNCKKYFPDWIKWDYIRDLFILPKYNQPKVLHQEISRYRAAYNNYPFHNYIHWDPKEDAGLILAYDRKFLNVIYAQHRDYFSEFDNLRDAADRTKNNIYDFIDNASRVAIAVDCENSDPFKLYSVIKGLDEAETTKISKITLYDDANTPPAWDVLEKYLHIPVEHIEVERIVGHKSLVDIKMAVSVSRDYYENGISSFLLFSSDSDFWGLISSMPQMKFLVMYEYDKCGSAILEAMREHRIPNCAIDDFCAVAAADLKKLVLLQELETRLPHILGRKPLEVAYEVYAETKIPGTKQDVENFSEKYIKTIKLQVMGDGTLELAIRK